MADTKLNKVPADRVGTTIQNRIDDDGKQPLKVIVLTPNSDGTWTILFDEV